MLEYWLWLTGRRGVGLRGLRALLEQFGTPEAVYCAAEQDYPQALRPAIRLDASAPRWPLTEADAILCINMIHISPWPATEGLIRQAGQLLPAGGPLYLYGPYRQSGVPLAASNAVFDDSLRRRNSKWGLRELDAVAELARAAGFGEPEVTAMPANNLSVVFRKR